VGSRRNGRNAGEAAGAPAPVRTPRAALDLRGLIERTASGLGYELVEIERAANGLIRVMIDLPEPPSGTGTGTGTGTALAAGAPSAPAARIGIEDCERVSRQLTHLFAVEEVSFERLEVSSPGLDRPLTSARDYQRFAGAPVHIHLRTPLMGRKRWRGLLLGLDGESGSEQVRLAVQADEAAPRAPGSGAKAAKGGKSARSAKAAKSAAVGPVRPDSNTPGQTVALPLADIEKARLVPQIDFGAAGRANKEGPR
jgi:ribosome maturation factor RimP